MVQFFHTLKGHLHPQSRDRWEHRAHCRQLTRGVHLNRTLENFFTDPHAQHRQPLSNLTINVSTFLTIALTVPDLSSPNGLLTSNSDGNYCGQQETVYVTVTAPGTTIDVAVGSASIQSAPSVGIQASSKTLDLQPVEPTASTDTATDITATSTIFITYTESVEVAHATPTSTIAGYGASPSTFIVPGAPVSTEASQDSTSDGTIFLTLTSTVHVTRTIVEVHNTTATSARSFTGIGAGGWNATGTTLQTVKAGPTGSGVTASNIQAQPSGVASAVGTGSPTGYKSSVSSPSGRLYMRNGKRQLGSIVVATINGVVVSWTNVWDGGAPATPIPSPPSAAEPPLIPGNLDTFPIRSSCETNTFKSSRSCIWTPAVYRASQIS